MYIWWLALASLSVRACHYVTVAGRGEGCLLRDPGSSELRIGRELEKKKATKTDAIEYKKIGDASISLASGGVAGEVCWWLGSRGDMVVESVKGGVKPPVARTVGFLLHGYG